MEAILDWFKETFSFIDAELLMMIGIAIITIILIKVLFKVLYRFTILKILLAIVILGGFTFLSVRYVQNHRDIFSNETSYYIYGTAGFISPTVNTFEIVSNKSNFAGGGTGDLVVKTSLTTKMYDNTESDKNRIKINDLKSGDVLQVFCKENVLKNGEYEVNAVKIIRKYSK